MRQILQHQLEDACLIGTMHVPGAERAAAPAKPRVGLLLANFAQAPRAGVGDLSAWLGDSVAAQGIPVFRFDLPGLGDSLGDTPEVGQFVDKAAGRADPFSFREAVWVKDSRVFADGQERKLFGSDDRFCAVVLNLDDEPEVWLADFAGKLDIEFAFNEAQAAGRGS